MGHIGARVGHGAGGAGGAGGGILARKGGRRRGLDILATAILPGWPLVVAASPPGATSFLVVLGFETTIFPRSPVVNLLMRNRNLGRWELYMIVILPSIDDYI